MFDNIPAELLQNIFSYLSPEDRARVSRINKWWRLQADDDHEWKALLAKLAGTHYEKDPTDTRSYKQIYLTAVAYLPEEASKFIEIITYSEDKFIYSYEENAYNYLNAVLEDISNSQFTLNIYSIVNYLLSSKYNFKNDSNTLRNFYAIEHILAGLNEPEALELIITQGGGDKNIKGVHGYTPLHIAVLQRCWDTCTRLKQLDADLLAKCDDDSTPMEYAAENFDYGLLKIVYDDALKNLSMSDGTNFFEHLLNSLAHQTLHEITEKPVDVAKLYHVKHEALIKYDVKTIDQELQQAFSKEEYAIIKTLDFFIEKGWSLPQWFTEIINFQKISEETDDEQPSKRFKSG